jgi:hypothetical protein
VLLPTLTCLLLISRRIVSKVPLEAPPFSTNLNNPATRRAWLRPIRKKTASVAGSGTSPSDSGSPNTYIKDDPNHAREIDVAGQTLMGQAAASSSNSVSPSGQGPTLTMNSSASPVFSGSAYEAYEALVHPPGSTGKPSPSNGLGMNGPNHMNGATAFGIGGAAAAAAAGRKHNGYQSMDGADLLNGTGLGGGPDDILALLGSSGSITTATTTVDPSCWDFGLMFPDGGMGNGNGNGDVGNGTGGLYGGSNEFFGSSSGTGFDARDGFTTGAV